MKRVLDSCVKAVINGSGHGDGTHSLICENEISTVSQAKSQPPNITDGQEILDAVNDSAATRRKKPRLESANEVVPPSSGSIASQGSEDISKATKDVESEGHPSAMVNLSVIHGPSDVSLNPVPPEEQFPYEPLNASKLESRIVTLHSGTQTEQIRCSLEHFATNKGSKPVYNALSYTWGSPASPKTIILNGIHIQVRANLWQALYHLRSEEQEFRIWIDALCINQNDPQERSFQVSRMSAIYELARVVVVWLGPAGDGSELAMAFLRRNFHLNKGPRTRDIPLTELLRESSGAEVQAVASLMAREYWHRVWIIQEVFRARMITVYCGSDTLEWSRLSRFFRYLTRQREQGQSQRKGIVGAECALLLDCCNSPAKHLTEHRTTQDQCLEELLIAYKNCHSSDPRDKVYALIGLSQRKVSPGSIPFQESNNWILVDYTKSTLDLFRTLVHLYRAALTKKDRTSKFVEWMQLLQEVLNLTDNIHSSYTVRILSFSEAPSKMEAIACMGFKVMQDRLLERNVASSPPWDPREQEYGHILQWLESIEWFDHSPLAKDRLGQILHHFRSHNQGRVKRFGNRYSGKSSVTSIHVSVLRGSTCIVLAAFPLNHECNFVAFLGSDIILVAKGDVIMGRAVIYKMSGPTQRIQFDVGDKEVTSLTTESPWCSLFTQSIALSDEDWARVVSVGVCPTTK